MSFVTTRHVGYAGRIRDPETMIRFKEGDEAIRDRLLELGAIAEIRDASPSSRNTPPPPSAGSAKPLSKMNKAELSAIVAAEGVEVAEGATNKAIIAAIEAKRVSKSEA